MRWQGRQKSSNVNDRRALQYHRSSMAGVGLIRLVPMAHRLFGIKGIVMLAIAGAAYFYFQSSSGMMAGSGGDATTIESSNELVQSESEQQLVDFVSVVLRDTEITWAQIFQKMGKSYKAPTLVLYRDATGTGCGLGSTAAGPFYCPQDQQVYIDLSFYHELAVRYKAPGDFAQAYVLAHEVGHHVQTLLGVAQRVHHAQAQLSKAQANRISVQLELQADCYAGVWAYYADKHRQMIEPDDLSEALVAATAVGDDTIQKRAQRYVVPDSFTHGTAAQRMQWFNVGFKSGNFGACDTFANQ